MRASSIIAISALAAVVSASPTGSDFLTRRAPVPGGLLVARAPITVFTDNETISLEPTAGGVASTNADGIDRGTNIASAVIDVINTVFSIIDKIGRDIEGRKRFTQQVVADTRTQFPDQNVVISNVGFSFDGTKTSQNTVRFDQKIGATVTFEVLTFQAGTFVLQGDGGFQNWAWIVDGDCDTSTKGTLICP